MGFFARWAPSYPMFSQIFSPPTRCAFVFLQHRLMPLPTLLPNSSPIIFTSPLDQFPIYKISHFAKLGPFSAINRTRALVPPSSLCPTSAFACGLGSFCAILCAWAMNGDGGSSKKLRKPYTITKSRDRWSEEEHERFLDGLLL